MTFELFTDVAPTPFPAVDDVQVRFYWHNGTTGNTSTPTAYPLFGQQSLTLGWNDFVTGMNKFAIGSQSAWCNACGNTTGVCASPSLTSPSSGGKGGSGASSSSSGGGSGSGGVSRPVAGVIGAFVTLAVVLGVEALIMLVAGLRLVSKKRLGAGAREGAVRPKA